MTQLTQQAAENAFVPIVGHTNVLVGEDVAARFDGYPHDHPCQATCIVRPGTTQEVSAIMALCHEHGWHVVTQGGRTGLVGAGDTTASVVALSLERMRSISAVDRDGATLEVEAGAPLEAVQNAAVAADLYYPVDFGSRGSATIGGSIATNAGGNGVVRYGMTRNQVLGLEAVLADGTIVCSMNRLLKNNTGYDLKQLLIGSEGTLGIITRAVLRLQPHPGNKAAAFVGVQSFPQVLEFLRHAMAMGDGCLSSFEVMWPSFLDCILEGGQHVPPLSGAHGFYVLLEYGSTRSHEQLEQVVASAWEKGMVEDAAIAQSNAQNAAFWKIRDDIETLTAMYAPAFLYDVSVPQRHMAEYVDTVLASLTTRWPAVRMATFGHIADGNLHLFIATGRPEDHAEVDAMVYAPLQQWGGSISAEHGIGLEKRDYLHVSRTPAEIALMQRIKLAFDPLGILNPGKIFG